MLEDVEHSVEVYRWITHIKSKDSLKKPSWDGFLRMRCTKWGIPEFRIVGESESRIPLEEGIADERVWC